MGHNSLGSIFQVTSFGESHGEGIGVVIDGCPAGISLDLDKIQKQLDRRKPGQSELTTARVESDTFKILSGLLDDKTTGAPICIVMPNSGFKKKDYTKLQNVFRPSHADYTYEKKYGVRDPFGGGRSSARITAGWVAAGAIAEQVLHTRNEINIVAFVNQIHTIKMKEQESTPNRMDVDLSLVRCPDKDTSQKMIERVLEAKAAGDSVGGVIRCCITNCPVGLGEPVFDKLHAQLAHAMMNINAVKGFEIGSGFDSANHFGSDLNDAWTLKDGLPYTTTNNSGGIQGGISNGMPIHFKVAFKPTSSIAKKQKTIDDNLNEVDIAIDGRHDPCVVPRAVPIVESLAAIVLLDNLLLQVKYG